MSEQNHSEEQLRKRKKGVTGREQLRQSHGGPRGTHPIDFSIGRSSWLTGEEGGASKGGRRHGDSCRRPPSLGTLVRMLPVNDGCRWGPLGPAGCMQLESCKVGGREGGGGR